MFRRNLVLGLILFLAIFVISPAYAGYSSNLVANYTFDASGDLGDCNPDTYDVGAAFGAPEAVTGVIGGAVNLTGDDGFTKNLASSSESGIYPASRRSTISVWVKANALPTEALTYVTTNRRTSCGFVVATVQNGTAYEWKVGTAVNGAVTYVDTGAAITVDAWTNLAFTFEAPSGSTDPYTGTGKFYVNGILVDTQESMVYTSKTSSATTQRFAIGVLGLGYNFFNGQVDDLGIWNTNLEDSAVASLYAAGLFEGQGLVLGADKLRQAFNSQTTYTINGHDWEYTQNLGTGPIGTIGGSIAGNDAFVILDSSGNGMMIPEPATLAILGIGGLMMFRKRR